MAGDASHRARRRRCILDLVDRGIIRILDIALMAKDADGTVGAMDLGALNGDSGGFEAFEGAATGMLGQDDLEEAAAALEPELRGGRAGVGEPLGGAGRGRAAKSGGQLVASGRIPVQAILAALDALEAEPTH